MLQKIMFFIGWVFVTIGISSTTSDAIIGPALMVVIGLALIKAVEVMEGGQNEEDTERARS